MKTVLGWTWRIKLKLIFTEKRSVDVSWVEMAGSNATATVVVNLNAPPTVIPEILLGGPCVGIRCILVFSLIGEQSEINWEEEREGDCYASFSVTWVRRVITNINTHIQVTYSSQGSNLFKQLARINFPTRGNGSVRSDVSEHMTVNTACAQYHFIRAQYFVISTPSPLAPYCYLTRAPVHSNRQEPLFEWLARSNGFPIVRTPLFGTM
jgi:hypothetical protein